MPRKKTATELESEYQSELKDRLYEILPDPVIEKFDIRQGYPDLLILETGWWGVLEVKIDEESDIQPNQPYYVTKFNHMSFGSFIWPAIEREVLNALQRSFESSRNSR